MQEYIVVCGAREHNLKNLSISLPRDKLIAVSGVSGSGKSSLVFDTIFAEGQRRYIESLSAYARQFLGRIKKPAVDYIDGLSPAICIEQKTTSNNPRSTVGTITEIYDYLRLLFARVGVAICPHDKIPIRKQSMDEIISVLFKYPEGEKCTIFSPIVRGRKGEHKKILDDIRSSGFIRVRINGTVLNLEKEIFLEKNKKHNIDILIDRVTISLEVRPRIVESLETALSMGKGVAYIDFFSPDKASLQFSETGGCPKCGFAMPVLEPRLFSFNSPQGACPDCSGLGVMLEFSEDLIIPDRRLSFKQGGFLPYSVKSSWNCALFRALGKRYSFDLDTPINTLSSEILYYLFHGDENHKYLELINSGRKYVGNEKELKKFSWQGIIKDLNRYSKNKDIQNPQWYERFMCEIECGTCHGQRLKAEALSVYVGSKNLHEIGSLSIQESFDFFEDLQLDATETQISDQIIKEIKSRLTFLKSVGLDYLSLTHRASTLSGGEAQRIRLATQLGSSLMGVLYVLDEPTIGLHQRDNSRLIGTLKRLRDLGNTVIVVEHDEQLLKESDHLVDIGPVAGSEGGYIVAQGTPEEVSQNDHSPTGLYLSGKEIIPIPKHRHKGTGKYLEIYGASGNNLKSVDVQFPIGCFNVITGVSGSGKSTLLMDTLYPALHNYLNKSHLLPVGKHKLIKGMENFDKIICIDQKPIGRTPRSNPVTYVGAWTFIRDLFATLPESRVRGYAPGRFSFNVKGGRCESCEGAGLIKVEMHFLPDVFVMCEICEGRRFNKETLSIFYKGKNIYDILEMTVLDACKFFENVPALLRKLITLKDVGVDYIKLGQSALTLSGGEAQRIKLSLELSKRNTGRTCYIIDEPTTGLHFRDVKKLVENLQKLIDMFNTIILIEHNLDVIKVADYIVDFGPEGGQKGGNIIISGEPEDIIKSTTSHTAYYLKSILKS